MHLGKTVCFAKASERLLADAFALLHDRYGRNGEIRHGATMFLGWSRAGLDALREFERSHRCHAWSLDPERLRAALFHDPRVGTYGLVRDLSDTLLLAHQVKYAWTCLGQAAEARGDGALKRRADVRGAEVKRQIEWLEMHLKLEAPQALTVRATPKHQLAAASPFRKTPVALPDSAFAPVTAALLVLAIGALSMAAGSAWLVPSLGPSAYLVAVEAAHPSTRPYNVLVGHLLGLGAGFLAIFLFGALDDPAVMLTGTMTVARLVASGVALFLTVAGALALQASHPPAGATTLAVTLGAIATPKQAVSLVVGAALIASFGTVLRYLRMGRTAHRRERKRPIGLGLARISHR